MHMFPYDSFIVVVFYLHIFTSQQTLNHCPTPALVVEILYKFNDMYLSYIINPLDLAHTNVHLHLRSTLFIGNCKPIYMNLAG
jgi:hypothetical protein